MTSASNQEPASPSDGHTEARDPEVSDSEPQDPELPSHDEYEDEDEGASEEAAAEDPFEAEEDDQPDLDDYEGEEWELDDYDDEFGYDVFLEDALAMYGHEAFDFDFELPFEYEQEWSEDDFSIDGDSGGEYGDANEAMVQQATEEMADLTAKHGPFAPIPKTYSMIVDARAHFQSADSIACHVPPRGRGKGVLLAVCNGPDVGLFSLPPGGQIDHAPARLGNVLFVACDSGLLNVYFIDLSKPPVPPVPASGSSLNLREGLPFMYAPLMPQFPHDPFATEPIRTIWKGEDRWRALHEKDRLALQACYQLQDMVTQPSAIPSLFHGPDDNYAGFEDMLSSVETQHALLPLHYMSSYYSKKYADLEGLAAMRHFMRVAEPSNSAGPSSPLSSNNRGAVVLGGVLALGITGEQAPAPATAVNIDSMVNGVRCGIVRGKERVLVAEQSGWVYVFEIPQKPSTLGEFPIAIEGMLCKDLGHGTETARSSSTWSMRHVNAFPVHAHEFGATVRCAATPMQTAAFGPFPSACNLAVASPDGRWIAVIGDFLTVHVLDQENGFAARVLSLDSGESSMDEDEDDNHSDEEDIDPGAQYCAFNTDSSLLAVASDHLRAVFVFSLPSGCLVHRSYNLPFPVLPVAFAPWDPELLVFTESRKRIHVRKLPSDVPHQDFVEELADPSPGTQLLVAGSRSLVSHNFGTANFVGMALTPHGDLLVATKQNNIHRFFADIEWGPDRMALWPPVFRDAVRTLLLCAHRQGESPVAKLPSTILIRIITALAMPRRYWLALAF